MYWLLAAIANVPIETVFYLAHRRFARDNPDIGRIATALMYSLGTLPVGLLWLYASTGSLQLNVTGSALMYCLVASFLFSLGILAGYIVDSRIEAAHSAIIHNLKPIVVIVLGWLVLGETLSDKQMIGACIVLVAGTFIVYLGTSRTRNGVKAHLPIYILAILAAINSGVATIFEKSAVDVLPLATYAVVGWGGQAMFLSLYAQSQFRKVPELLISRKIYFILFLGLLRGLASVTFVYALKVADNAPLITIIAASKTTAIVLGGFWLLRETDHAIVKFAVAVATSIGIILLAT